MGRRGKIALGAAGGLVTLALGWVGCAYVVNAIAHCGSSRRADDTTRGWRSRSAR